MAEETRDCFSDFFALFVLDDRRVIFCRVIVFSVLDDVSVGVVIVVDGRLALFAERLDLNVGRVVTFVAVF